MGTIAAENNIKAIHYAERVCYPSAGAIYMNIPNCFRMFCVLSGTLVLEVNGKTLHCEPLSALILPPQTLHEIPAGSDHTTEVLEIWFELNDEDYIRDLNNAGVKIPVDDFTLYCVQQVSVFINSKESYLRGHAYSFLDVALSQICVLSKVLSPYTRVNMTGFSNATKSVIIYIDTHFTEHFILEDMGKEIDFNPSYLCVVFRRDTGATINDYLNFVRIIHFINLFFIENCNDNSIGAISRCCGFSNVAHFNRTFKKFLGTTPSQYKEQRLSQYSKNLLALDIKNAGTMYGDLHNVLDRMLIHCWNQTVISPCS